MEFILKEEIEPYLCLNMIVKNESHIIRDTLEKLLKKIKFDYWVISDTGSTDNTKEIILDFFKEVNICGEIFDDEWKGFGHNRTKALEHAFKKSKYLLVFDADDELCGDFVLPELVLDSYHFQFGDASGISYTRTQLINNQKKWKYFGVLHEFIGCMEPTNGTNIIRGNYYTVSGKSGNRSKDSNKYLKDAKILEEAYDEAVNNNDAIYNRYGFYCANSYYDCGKYEDAIKWYKKTLESGCWCQEKYVSCLRIYNCYKCLKQQETGFFYLVKSAEYDKERVECFYELIQHYCSSGLNENAYAYYTVIKPFYDTYLTNGLENKLFIDCSKANFFLPYYMIIVAHHVKDYDTGLCMFRTIFTKKHKEFNKFFVGNMLFNLQFFTEQIKSEDLDEFKTLFKGYIDFLLANNYPLYDHDFMNNYEKFGIIVPKFEPEFSREECSKSKKILIYTGYAPFEWNYSFSLENALGGSETAASCLSKSFPKEYEIYVSGGVKEEKVDNVTYVNLHNLKDLIKTNAFHTIIVSRYLHFYEVYKNFSAYQTFIWGHDIELYSYGADISINNILSKWSSKITGCVCQTEWHKNRFLSLYPELKDKINVINNGIQVELFTSNNKKESNKFIYTSCSERGLSKLIQLWPSILENLPDAELTISSYNKFPNTEEDYKNLEYINQTPSIKHVGKLNRPELYNLMSNAEYWLYPSYFPETSCITSLEMLASQVICLYYPVAGLVNTVGDYGMPIAEGNEIDTLLNLSMKRKCELKIRGKEYALSCSWNNRANEWCSMIFPKELQQNNIKVINLKKREDRKNSMIEQFKKETITNYEFVEAVGGNELTETEELRLLFEGNNFNYRKGVIGCALSHIHVWNTLINDNNNDYYVILEDDVELSSDFKQKLEIHCKLFEEQQLEHLSLGTVPFNWIDQEKIKTSEITIFQKDVYNLFHVAFAYIISKNAARKMVSYINKCSVKAAIDHPLCQGEVVKYSHTTHCIVKQYVNELGTDIQNNYNTFNFTSKSAKADLKIAYCDWWYHEYCGGHFDINNNFIIDILRKYGNVGEIIVVNPDQSPDILFYSIFGNEHIKYTNVRRVFFSGEPFGIRSEADFNLTFDRNSEINTRFPLWLGYLNAYLLEECNRRKNGIVNVPKRENFCSFIANGEVKTTHRKTIVEKLSTYKKVHCGGNYLNNIGYTVPRGINCSGKIEHNSKYKFAISFENEDYPGYVTEKICDIYKSNCIPIYWGTKEVVNDFNPTTFINANDFANFDELVEYIVKVDNDDELYASFFKEPMFSNKWLDAFNDPNKTFYKNLADCIIGKYSNLYDNYLRTINCIKTTENTCNHSTNINIFNIWHNKLFDKCYKDLDDYSLSKVIMYDVNDKYSKIFNNEKNYNIVKEYELKHYNSLYQDTNYCQTSCLYHVFKNQLHKNTDYIGFIQYDMELDGDFIYDMEQRINKLTNRDEIYFYSLAVANKVDVPYICNPYNNSILEKYNTYFNTNHSYESIKSHFKSDKFICLHTFVIPTKTFIKMMTWYCSIADSLHSNYINDIYAESMCEVTEELFGLFLLLQMIENDSIKLEILKLNHEWPNLHNETEWNDYKVRMPASIKIRANEINIQKITEKFNFEINRISDINQHLPTLYNYARECESIIECGVRGCVSSWAFALGLLNNNKCKKSILLNDIEVCDVEKFLELTTNIGLDVKCEWCSDLDLQIHENVDLTFIDTLHVYGQLKRELEKFSKITTKFIIMHDTSVDEIYGECIRCGWDASTLALETGFPIEDINRGLQPAIDEFLESNRDWVLHERYTNNNGLTILKKNGTLLETKICFDISKNFTIEYGIEGKKIDITDIVMKNVSISNYSEIPAIDEMRAILYGDPIFGTRKFIFITSADGKYLKFSENEGIVIDITNHKILTSINPDVLTVYKSPYNKIRLGKEYDGGYIVCDIPNIKYDFFISGGILDDISFEEDFCNKYNDVKCNAYDGYIDNIYIKNKNISFIKKYIGNVTENNFTNLHDIINNFNNIFVKMDIEGSEIEWLKSLSENQIDKFAQIVMEFHNPFCAKEIIAFEKLNRNHVLVHFHANNCCGVRNHKGVNIPNVFECTYIHKKYYTEPYKLNNEIIPGLLDMKNVLDKDEIIIDYKPFVN